MTILDGSKSISRDKSSARSGGFTLVGTLQPFKLEKAYGYFDSGPRIDATSDFDGKGMLDINHGRGVIRDLFSSAITGFEGFHPGIIFYSPQLNAEISMVGSGEIDAKFSAHFDCGAASQLMTHAPPTLGKFDGSALPSTTIMDPVTGDVSGQERTEHSLCIQCQPGICDGDEHLRLWQPVR